MRTISWLALGAAALALGCASGSASTAPSEPHPATAAGDAATGGTSVLGTIQNYTQSPSGQMNGFVLATGQRVRIPESMGAKVSDLFAPNTPVRVTGHMVADTDGRPILEADQLMNPTSKATLDLTAARVTPPSPVPSSIGGSGTGGTPPDPSSTGTPSGSTTAPASPGQQPPTGR
ncbi:MAG: hypothetical protein ACXWLG_04150 [Myxococcaceae bacterium]